MKNTRRILFGLALAAAVGLAAPNLDELRALLRNRTDEARKAVGIVAGLVDATGVRFVASGATAPGATTPPDADTVFEIGGADVLLLEVQGQANTSFGVDDIGLHAVEPQWPAPLLPPAAGRPAEAVTPQSQSAPPVSPADLAIWKEFVAAMRQGGPGPDRVQPYYENLREPILGWLKEMREKAVWAEWERTPEVHHIGEHVHFLIPLTFDGQTATYCLTFLVENGRWYFRHIEAINIRLDRTGPLPASTFPDVDEATKARIREETHWSREVRVFNELAALKGKDTAFDFFKDGEGYFLTAKTWVPFVEPRRALVLYACWEQANLTGNEVTLEKLDDQAAVVKISAYYFRLYHESAHLPQQIPFEDYKRIFETIWKDRARAAGWTVEIEYGDEGYRASSCVLRFK